MTSTIAAADPDVRAQAVHEVLYSEHVLAKSGHSVLLSTLDGHSPAKVWDHYPPGDVYDPESGAQWYYHCHPPTPETESEGAEHGHFHCFVRPQGKDGPVHHIVGLGVDANGRLLRLFTVNQWVVGDDWLDASGAIALLPRFDVQLDRPSYLVNRWLSAVVRLYAREISDLIRARDRAIQSWQSDDETPSREDRKLEVTSECAVNLAETAAAVSVSNTPE